MAKAIKSFGYWDDEIEQYVKKILKLEDPKLEEIRIRSKQAGLPNIHIGACDGRHLEVLTRAIGAKYALEIGTLGGYSGLCIVRGLDPEGNLTTIELYPKNAALAEETFALNGEAKRTNVICGKALDCLKNLLSDAENHGKFDLIFLDADKVNYTKYLPLCYLLLKKGGSLFADNTFAWGLVSQKVYLTEGAEKEGNAIKLFNAELAQHPGFRSTILPTGDGLTVAVKL